MINTSLAIEVAQTFKLVFFSPESGLLNRCVIVVALPDKFLNQFILIAAILHYFDHDLFIFRHSFDRLLAIIKPHDRILSNEIGLRCRYFLALLIPLVIYFSLLAILI
jgi:hypothetical protein